MYLFMKIILFILLNWWCSTSSAQKAVLATLAGNDSYAASYARGILRVANGGDTLYREPMPHLPNAMQQRQKAKKATTTAAMQMLTVAPNPATDYAVLHYNVAETGITMQIVDAAGHILLNKTLDNTIGDITLTTADWSAGIYQIVLQTKGKTIATQSFIIAK
jgi:hypothetical protein